MTSKPVINPNTYAFLQENLAEILPELESAFIEDAFTLLAQIKTSLGNSDSNTISTATHTLKSSALNIGADTLADYCVQMEDSPSDIAKLTQLHQQALAELQAVQTFLNQNH